jgi:hypothetical protein
MVMLMMHRLDLIRFLKPLQRNIAAGPAIGSIGPEEYEYPSISHSHGRS